MTPALYPLIAYGALGVLFLAAAYGPGIYRSIMGRNDRPGDVVLPGLPANELAALGRPRDMRCMATFQSADGKHVSRVVVLLSRTYMLPGIEERLDKGYTVCLSRLEGK